MEDKIDFSALVKPFYAEPRADAGSDKITCVGESLLTKIMCAPKSATESEIENAAGAAGTSTGWQIAHDRADCCVQCLDDENRQHWLLLC